MFFAAERKKLQNFVKLYKIRGKVLIYF